MPASVTGINTAVDAIRKEVTLLHRTIMFDLDRVIVQKTPRDTGLAKGNWIASIGSPHRGTTTKLHKTNNTPSIERIRRPCISYLSNNLPYIERLNEGWGKEPQAPAGYIDDAIKIVVAAHK